MGFTISIRTIGEFALTVGAGWLGGAMAARQGGISDVHAA
jgi:hypothetical protein